MKRRRQQEIYFESRVLEKVDEISKQLKDCGDEDELFLMSLVPAFKRLSEIQKSTARIEIMRVLHDIQFKEK